MTERRSFLAHAAASLCAAALGGSIASCARIKAPALRVGATIRPTAEPMQLAQQEGRYDDGDVLLIDFLSASEVMRAYRNRVIDLAAVSADEALLLAEAEPGAHKIIIIAANSAGIDGILAQPAHPRFDLLKGKRVGVEPNTLGTYILARALEKSGMALHDIQPVPLTFDQHVDAFEAGKVEAIVTGEPNRSTLLVSGAQEVFSTHELPGEVFDVIVTRAERIASRQEGLVQFARGWFWGTEYLGTHAIQAAQSAATHERVTPDSFAASLSRIRFADRQRNLSMTAGGDSAFGKSMSLLADRMRQNGLLRSPLAIETLIDRTIVESATS